MKTLYALIVTLCTVTIANCQIINFPDPNLKSKLLLSSETNNIAVSFTEVFHKIDSNSNGEIEISEALLVKELNIGESNINDLTGIELFSNLEFLDCKMNNLTALNLGSLHLRHLDFSYNQISSIDLSQSFATIGRLFCQNNDLTSLQLHPTAPFGVADLDCSFNAISILELSGEIVHLNLTANAVTDLDLSNCNITSCGAAANPYLRSINIKNGLISGQVVSNMYNMTNLRYVCADEGEIWNVEVGPLVQVNTYCSFTPGGSFYEIIGTNKVDLNGNGCDASDPTLPLKFNITNAATLQTVISNAFGNYFPVTSGNFVVTPVIENPSYFTISPSSVSVSFPAAATPFNQDFCITPNGIHNDIGIAVIPHGPAVPGFDSHYEFAVTNKGNQIQSGTINFTYDDSVLDFVTASGTFTNSSGLATLDFSNLQPFESRSMYITLNLNSPMETPPLNADDVLTFTTSVLTAETDETPTDNTKTITQTVVNSMDPNHKTCVEGATIPPSMVGEYVLYIIEFENVGTFPATNVVVKDMIDTAKFDVSTLVPVASSHSYFTRITETNKVEFIFENINLPFDDTNNDGYIAFKIKTKPTLVLGNTFSNTASIYFDYNFPIITNTETTTISALSNQDFEFGQYFTIFPNPVNDMLNINTNNAIELHSISIFNMLGQQLVVIPNAQNLSSVDVSALQSGTYFIKVVTDKGTSAEKFIKQ